MDIAHLALTVASVGSSNGKFPITLGYKRNPQRVPYNSVLLHFYLTTNEKFLLMAGTLWLSRWQSCSDSFTGMESWSMPNIKEYPGSQKGDQQMIENYRPVLCFKFFWKTTSKKDSWTWKSGKQQHGFMKNRSTVTADLLLQSLIAHAMDNDCYVALPGIYLRAAFIILKYTPVHTLHSETYSHDSTQINSKHSNSWYPATVRSIRFKLARAEPLKPERKSPTLRGPRGVEGEDKMVQNIYFKTKKEWNSNCAISYSLNTVINFKCFQSIKKFQK